ncbi:magnesium transporter [Stenotrophomonas sp. NPDC077659]|uniref:magnesium transporter n=1 Tax=Stenotrophomonas sp. NPDC077659 TaxID=3390694 RepID=UPI003CFD697D
MNREALMFAIRAYQSSRNPEGFAPLARSSPPSDTAAALRGLSPNPLAPLLMTLDTQEREDILRLSSYDEGTVGAVTTSDFVAVDAGMTVAEALAHIRATASDKDTIYVVYVLDGRQALRGTVSLRDLVLADAGRRIGDIAQPDPVSVHVGWPQARASEVIRHYDLLAVPVVNDEQRMIGIVTVNDVMDIEKEQDASQLARFGGTASMAGNDLDVVSTPLRTMFGVRVFWLAMLTVFGIITSTFVASQEELLGQVIVLAAFIAPIVDMGGNTGSQSATLVIRAMALGELELKWRDVGFVIRREIPVALLLGLCVAVLEAILACFSKGVGVEVLLVVGLSMLVCTVAGGIIGALLPFAARRIGTDPATLSSPLITSVMDLLGVFIYFGFAWLLLGDLLVTGA